MPAPAFDIEEAHGVKDTAVNGQAGTRAGPERETRAQEAAQGGCGRREGRGSHTRRDPDARRPRMNGTMIWFNADKGYGYIRTEDDERLYVAASGFVEDEPPTARCG